MTMRPVLAAASSYELSEDKTTWTFTIRKDAVFSNGDPVRAEDFRDSWLSYLSVPDAPFVSFYDIIQGVKEFRTGQQTDPESIGIKAQDGKLIVTLNSPAAFFPSMLCHYAFGVVHHDTLAMLDSGEFDSAAYISNGPFTLADIDEGGITLAKNETYWDAGSVSLNNIRIKYVDDADEATMLWNTGEARWIAGNVNLDTLADRVGIQINPMFGTHYYFIRCDEAPWNDPRVRKALSISLPWNEIRGNYFLPAETLILPLQGYPEVTGYSAADIAVAEKLLAEAGYPKGAGLPELTIKIGAYAESERVAGIMAQTWYEKLGIPVKINPVPSATYSDTLKDDDYEVGYMSWIGDFADPYTFLLLWEKDSNLNDAHYNDPDYEALIRRSMVEDGETRMKTLAEAEQMLLDRGVVLPMYYTPAINIIDTDEIEGWYPNMLDIHPFKHLSFARLRPLPGVARTDIHDK
jgi:peptide/nickel transport system substrate-binding protein/oligopeptide transport system substrate-binding protein